LTNTVNSQWTEVPPYALWLFGLAAAGWIIGPLLGFYFGRRSQEEAEKLKARIDALAIADGVSADIPKQLTLLHLFLSTRDALRDATFRFSCQLSERKRLRIEKALNAYQALDISYSWPPTEGKPDMQIVDKEHKIMLEALKFLRDEIDNA
jgi:hypothetical protein